MKMKTVLISHIRTTHLLGIKYLHAHLRAKGHESIILLVSGREAGNLKAVLDHIAGFRPDVFLLSAMSCDFAHAKGFARMLKERFPGIPVIFGGIHPTLVPEECFPEADIVVRGEGEETIIEVLDALKNGGMQGLEKVKGIVFEHAGNRVLTQVRQPVQDLDQLACPGHLPDGMLAVLRGRIYPVREPYAYKRFAPYQGSLLYALSSRGCFFSCTYCSNSGLTALYGTSRARMRSAGPVVDEIVNEVRNFKDIYYVMFQDDCFMMHSLEWAEDFSARYRKEVGLPFLVKSSPNYIDKDKIACFKSAGLRWVSMGLESASDRVNREVFCRETTASQFINAARLLAQEGIFCQCDLIVGNPYETQQERLDAIDLLSRIPRPVYLRQFPLEAFPGTVLARMAGRDGFILPLPPDKMAYFYNSLAVVAPAFLSKFFVRHRRNFLMRVSAVGVWFFCSLFSLARYAWVLWRTNGFRLRATFKSGGRYLRVYIASFAELLMPEHDHA